MKHYPMVFTATLMLSLGPFPGALSESGASLTVVSQVSEGRLQIFRFDNPDECQSGKQIARLTSNKSFKTTPIVGGAEVAIMINYNYVLGTDFEYEAGGLVAHSNIRVATAILKFDSVVGEHYELVIEIDKDGLIYRLQKSQTADAVEFRTYALAQEMKGSHFPRITKQCVGNTLLPPSETRVPTELDAYQTCIARGVPRQSCATNYLSE